MIVLSTNSPGEKGVDGKAKALDHQKPHARMSIFPLLLWYVDVWKMD